MYVTEVKIIILNYKNVYQKGTLKNITGFERGYSTSIWFTALDSVKSYSKYLDLDILKRIIDN